MAEKEQSFNEQAYLMWTHFINKRKPREKADLSGAISKTGMSFHRVVGNYQPGDLISKLISVGDKYDRYQNILDLESYKISSLVPEVRFFRITNNRYVPFYFPESVERTTMGTLLSPGSSLGAVGVRSFDFNLTGTDFFTRDKVIECSLSIYTDSMENIFKEPAAGYAQISELFTISSGQNGLKTQIKEGFSKEISTDQINRPLSHEIAVQVGYSMPEDESIFTSRERQAIQNTSMMLRLTYTGHNISVSQDGQTSVDITYIGRMDGALNSSMYNVLSDGSDIIELSKIQSDINFFKSESSVNQAQNKAKIQALQSKVKTSKRKRVSKITQILRKEKKVYTSSVTPEDLKSYKSFVSGLAESGPSNTTKEKPKKPQPVSKQEAPNQKSESEGKKKIPRNNIMISYYYMGDIIQAVIKSMINENNRAIAAIQKDKKNTPKQKENLINEIQVKLDRLSDYKFLFGDVTVYTGAESAIPVNLADIPVSSKVLAQHFFNSIVQTQTTRLSITDFLNQVINKLYPSCLNNHLYRDASNLHDPIGIKSTTMSGSDLKNKKTNSDINIREGIDVFSKKSSGRSFSDDKEYYIIYSDMAMKASSSRNGDREVDKKSGVYHFNMSKDRGMLKSIDFSQASVQYRKEALMLESVSLFDELKMPYNVSISMHGNTMFLPGSMIYVNPSSIGFGDPRNPRSAASRLGIGGYYVIISVKTSYNNGILSTVLDARHQDWASDGDRIDTLQELQQLGITDKARRSVNRGEGSVYQESGIKGSVARIKGFFD